MCPRGRFKNFIPNTFLRKRKTMIRSLLEKVDNVQEQMVNVSREMGVLRKIKKKF